MRGQKVCRTYNLESARAVARANRPSKIIEGVGQRGDSLYTVTWSEESPTLLEEYYE